MNINDMNKQEKSAVLLALAGCNVQRGKHDATGQTYQYVAFNSGEWIRLCEGNTLYDEQNMALAWRVLNWAEDLAQSDTRSDFYSGWMGFLPETLFALEPEKAQTAWLDKILELAIEAGMVAQELRER